MKSISKLTFIEKEISTITKLQDLFDEAYEYGEKLEFIKGYKYTDLTTDGIFPYYLKQKIKILFVGRDHCEIGTRYLDTMYHNHYDSGKLKQFHKYMYKIAYAFNHNLPDDWKKIPEYSIENFAVENGVSFGFINCSKFMNDTGSPKVDIELLMDFTEKYSSINLLSRQINIINPDIIITMNLSDLSDYGFSMQYLGNCDFVKCYNGLISTYKYLKNDSFIPLFDTYHFSWAGLSGINVIDKLYIPLRSAYKEFMEENPKN